MGTIDLATSIAASPERCFDLARDIDAHVASAAGTNERAVGDRTHGLLGVGDEVTWEARHFGVVPDDRPSDARGSAAIVRG